MKLTAQSRRRLIAHPAGWIASGFFSGFAPVAPGTFGSAVALLPYMALRQAPWWGLALAIVVVFAIGVRCADWVIDEIKIDDPGVVVVDEFVGQWITLALMEAAIFAAPQTFPPPSLWSLLLIGFVVFRACDIVKPWPASWADRALHGGFGAMFDDAIAGVWAGVAGAFVLFAIGRLM